MGNIETLVEFSNKYGARKELVIGGGGNTSYKDSKILCVKGTGMELADIKADGFVKLDRKALDAMLTKKYSKDDSKREAEVLEDMLAARIPGETGKPSVECILHNLFPQKFVLHIHPSNVNGINCSKKAKSLIKKLFPDAVFTETAKPGYCLAIATKKKLDAYKKATGKNAELVFLQDHGVFFAADNKTALDKLVKNVLETVKPLIKKEPDFSDTDKADKAKAVELMPAIRMLYAGKEGPAVVCYAGGKAVLEFDPNSAPCTPFHIIYTKRKCLIIDNKDIALDDLKKEYAKFTEKNGYKPVIVYVKGVGAFCCGRTKKDADIARGMFTDTVRISVYAKSFGGYAGLTEEFMDTLPEGTDHEYTADPAKRLDGKVTIVTGAAQGFGKGIAEQMAKQGAYIIVADMNYDGAVQTASELPFASAVRTNVSDEESVKALIDETVLEYGGLDVFVNNAGIVRAGSLEEMTKPNFELVTAVNYTAYFICAKYAIIPMKIQHKIAPEKFFDIIQINSKSGLTGSNKNFAYAGSKFGGLGLTQSFALELAPFNIKVNSVCPGNFLDGPLWTDPVKGLLVQYLNAGKVPGAKTTDDVLKYYESKVPLNRGCRIMDVARAIMYIIEQEYETGQAIPVTGGQEMLN